MGTEAFCIGKSDSFYCVTTVIFHGLNRESQTIDSGSSHYSTLFKEHPLHKAHNVLAPFPSMRMSA